MRKIIGFNAAPYFYFEQARISFTTLILSMKTLLYSVLLLLFSCSKVDALLDQKLSKDLSATTHYVIKSGEHAVANNTYKVIETDSLQFSVRFDSTAIYQTITKENQYDINKLYGFADNASDHHQYSARFGWAWHDAALHLYAYVYNEGKRGLKHLGTVPIGAEVACTIAVTPTQYVFHYGDVRETVPRSSTTPKAKGYLLYPYFGGDETAPHNINIWIRHL